MSTQTIDPLTKVDPSRTKALWTDRKQEYVRRWLHGLADRDFAARINSFPVFDARRQRSQEVWSLYVYTSFQHSGISLHEGRAADIMRLRRYIRPQKLIPSHDPRHRNKGVPTKVTWAYSSFVSNTFVTPFDHLPPSFYRRSSGMLDQLVALHEVYLERTCDLATMSKVELGAERLQFYLAVYEAALWLSTRSVPTPPEVDDVPTTDGKTPRVNQAIRTQLLAGLLKACVSRAQYLC